MANAQWLTLLLAAFLAGGLCLFALSGQTIPQVSGQPAPKNTSAQKKLTRDEILKGIEKDGVLNTLVELADRNQDLQGKVDALGLEVARLKSEVPKYKTAKIIVTTGEPRLDGKKHYPAKDLKKDPTPYDVAECECDGEVIAAWYDIPESCFEFQHYSHLIVRPKGRSVQLTVAGNAQIATAMPVHIHLIYLVASPLKTGK